MSDKQWQWMVIEGRDVVGKAGPTFETVEEARMFVLASDSEQDLDDREVRR